MPSYVVSPPAPAAAIGVIRSSARATAASPSDLLGWLPGAGRAHTVHTGRRLGVVPCQLDDHTGRARPRPRCAVLACHSIYPVQHLTAQPRSQSPWHLLTAAGSPCLLRSRGGGCSGLRGPSRRPAEQTDCSAEGWGQAGCACIPDLHLILSSFSVVHALDLLLHLSLSRSLALMRGGT